MGSIPTVSTTKWLIQRCMSHFHRQNHQRADIQILGMQQKQLIWFKRVFRKTLADVAVCIRKFPGLAGLPIPEIVWSCNKANQQKFLKNIVWFADCNFQNWIIRNAEAAVDKNQQWSGLRFFWLYEVIRFGMKSFERWSVQRDKHFRKENQSSICTKDCWENCLNCALQFKIFIKTRVAADRKTRKPHPSFLLPQRKEGKF